MKVRVDFNDGTEPEEIEVTEGSVHFHPFPEGDTEKHIPTIEVLEEDPVEDEDQPAGELPAGDDDYEVFDPSAHTIAEVEAFVNEHPNAAEAILAAEEAGKNRVTLVEWLEDYLTS